MAATSGEGRSVGDRPGAAAPPWFRHPVAVPVGVAALAVLLLIGVGWVAAIAAAHTVEVAAQDDVRSYRDAAVRALVGQADGRKVAAATWAADGHVIESLRAPTPAARQAVETELRTMARGEGAPSAFLTDTRGRSVANYPRQPEIIGKDFAFRDWYKGVVRTGKPYVSEAYRTAATGHPLVVGVAAPVLDHSRTIGYVTVLWQLDSVRRVSLGSQTDDGVTIQVTDQRGQALTGALSVDDRGQALATPVSATTREALAGHDVSTVGGGLLTAAGPVPGVGWTVTAELPSSVALAPARGFQRTLGLTLGVALALVLAILTLALLGARRRSEEQAAARYARSLIEAGLDPLMTISPEGKITDVNEATTKVTGVPREELVGTAFSAYFTEPEKAEEGYRLVFAQGSITGYELTMVHRDGTLTEVLYNAAGYRDASGTVLGVYAAAHDVTEQRRAQADLASQAKELDRLAELERFQRLTVGRELKMVELKGQIETLKRRLSAP